MPNYAFQCKKCGEQFEVHESVKEHDLHKEQCPKCRSCSSTQVRTPS